MWCHADNQSYNKKTDYRSYPPRCSYVPSSEAPSMLRLKQVVVGTFLFCYPAHTALGAHIRPADILTILPRAQELDLCVVWKLAQDRCIGAHAGA